MNWIATWLAARDNDYKGDGFIHGVYVLLYDNRTRRVILLRKLRAARQERDLARTKLSEAMTAWRADLDSYSAILCKSGMGDLREKVRSLEHEIMGLVIAYRELSEARATIAMLTQERDALLSRLGEWRERIERMDELA